VFALLLAIPTSILAGCGDDGPRLTEAGARGRAVAADNGCQACHGRNGEGGVGPSWIGLAGADVELDGGTTVTADDDYLRRSIVEPRADTVAGYNVLMPTNSLSPAEVDLVIAYIKDLR
jgi:cytochrome c oxidase subunit 2